MFSRAGRRATVLQEETVPVQTNLKDKRQEDGKEQEDDTLKYPRADNTNKKLTRARQIREIHDSQG